MNRAVRMLRAGRAAVAEITGGERDPWLAAVLVAAAALYLYRLDWGLPNGNFAWAADAIGPLTVLNVGRRSLGTWNSGWFWYKYPFGYPLLLLLVYAPYLGLAWATGALRHPTTTFPYGFADARAADAALYTLALLGRGVSVALMLGTVALTYGIARRVFGRVAGRLAAWFVATAYPVVYYAHTTNQDTAYLFWLVLALWAAMVAAETTRRWPYVVLGVAAGMAMATKEQGFALLLSLPPILAVSRYRSLPATEPFRLRAWKAVWNPGTRAGLVAAVVALLVGNNVLVNPSGLLNRMRDLSGHPVPGMSSRMLPLHFSLFKGFAKEWWYVRQLVDVLESTFGLPLFLVGAVGLGYVAWKLRRAAFYLLLPFAAYYAVSLRTHELLVLRYALPLVPIMAACAAAACVELHGRFPAAGAVLAIGLCALGLARAVELDLLLRTDSRYQAEAWLEKAAAPGSSVEFYQKRVYLPRLDGFTAREVALGDRTPEGLRQRQPDFVVISSAGRGGITRYWNPDPTKGGLMLEKPEARAMLAALEDGSLPYRRAARFAQTPRLLRLRITSLCPEITIFQRLAAP